MDAILEQLNRLRGVGGSLVLSQEGLPMASLLRDGIDEDQLCAILADLIDRTRRMCDGVGVGAPKLLSFQSESGTVVLRATGANYLAILVDPQANLALLELETRPIVEALTRAVTL